MTEIYRDGEIDTGYPDSDEMPHPVGPDGLWQESVVLCWWDHQQGIGGFHRIGHEPYYAGGTAFLTSFVCTRSGVRHRLVAAAPLRPGDHGHDVFKFGNRYAMRWDGKIRWEIDEPGCSAELVVTNYLHATDLWPRKGNTLSTNIAAAHTECPGSVSGVITLDGHRYQINGTAYRDHSWGKRDWSLMDHHTWLAASCGPQDSYGHVNFFDTSGNNVWTALHYTGNQIFHAASIEINPSIDPVSRLLDRGEIVLNFPHRQRVRSSFEPVDGVSLIHHGYLLTNHLCDLQIDGRPGFLVLETGLRINQEIFPIELKTLTTNGLSRRG